MAKKPSQSQNSPEDRDAWESLAEDLFGVDLHKKPLEPIDDDLLLDPVVPPAPQPQPSEPASIVFEESTPEPVAEVNEPAEEDVVAEADEDDDDDDFTFESASDAKVSRDDFWAALEQFAPEELATPIVPNKEAERKADQKKIGARPLVSGPVTDVPVQRDEFVENTEFGVGILDDLEVDDPDDESGESNRAEGGEEGTGEGDRSEKSRRRRPRRRRRGRKKPAEVTATAEGVEPAAVVDDGITFPEEDDVKPEKPAPAPAVSSIPSNDDDDDDDDDEEEDYLATGSAEDDDEDDPRPRYKNVPTWAQAISYLKKKSDAPRGESTSSSSAPAEKKTGSGRRRSRGGSRRRRKPDANKEAGDSSSPSAPAAPSAEGGE